MALVLCIVVSACGFARRTRRTRGQRAMSGRQYDELEGGRLVGDQLKSDRAASSRNAARSNPPRVSEWSYTADFSLEVESIRQSLDRIGSLVKVWKALSNP